MTDTIRILIIEDDQNNVDLLVDVLEQADFVVTVAMDAGQAVAALNLAPLPDLIISDICLPDINGRQLMRQLQHSYPEIPYMFLSALHSEGEIVEGLDQGAEDYLLKPFKAGELLSRVRKILGRSGAKLPADQQREPTLFFPALVINPTSGEVIYHQQLLEITGREFELLYLLASSPGRIFSRSEILDRLWQDDYEVSDRIVDTHISHLRLKFEGPELEQPLIKTVRGKGYVFNLPRVRKL